jgi:hypothetical protein
MVSLEEKGMAERKHACGRKSKVNSLTRLNGRTNLRSPWTPTTSDGTGHCSILALTQMEDTSLLVII